jgi:RNA polymerase sigma factor (sigma-70 family)
MSSATSVTTWLGQLKAGDRQAAQKLWERYFEKLVAFARSKLQSTPRRAADEEDVALSAFNKFWRVVQKGGFPKLDDRDDLWRLLVLIAAQKASDLRDRERAKKRPQTQAAVADLEQIIGHEPTPEFAIQVAEEYEALLRRLPEELRIVAIRKMEGYTNAEIAAELGVIKRTIERKLSAIRGKLKESDSGRRGHP